MSKILSQNRGLVDFDQTSLAGVCGLLLNSSLSVCSLTSVANVFLQSLLSPLPSIQSSGSKTQSYASLSSLLIFRTVPLRDKVRHDRLLCRGGSYSVRFNSSTWHRWLPEYHNKILTKLFNGNSRLACYALAITIFLLGIFRDALSASPCCRGRVRAGLSTRSTLTGFSAMSELSVRSRRTLCSRAPPRITSRTRWSLVATSSCWAACGHSELPALTWAITLASWWTTLSSRSLSTSRARRCITGRPCRFWALPFCMGSRWASCWPPRYWWCIWLRWVTRSKNVPFIHGWCENTYWRGPRNNSPFTAEIYAKRDRAQKLAKKGLWRTRVSDNTCWIRCARRSNVTPCRFNIYSATGLVMCDNAAGLRCDLNHSMMRCTNGFPLWYYPGLSSN